jgi:Putative amidoligase enzyme
VLATWGYLRQHYEITADFQCGTHIHVSFEPPGQYIAEDIRRIARCVIHFEPAIEALMPLNRRQNVYVKSNWLEGELLGKAYKSRRESIAAIDEEGDMSRVIALMQHSSDRDYCWNFLNLCKGKATIEFRKPPPSTTSEEALSWAEFAMSFIQASVKHGTPNRLQRVPSTVGGLRWFLDQAYRGGLNEPDRLGPIWAGKADNAALQPQLNSVLYQSREKKLLKVKLENLAMEDQCQILQFARSVREPYWPLT